ncbi:MAG: antibiotic biosynthesis monooxygenase [Geobacteraceae bacterium]|nr:antibiotic biosynthesis monooxygenase [Geobacteraceae bacterium]
MMILSIVKIAPLPGKREDILCVLRSIKGPVQAMSDCVDCRICQEDGDDGDIIFLEQWVSWEAFMRHIRSELYGRMLEAMELSRREPEVSFFEVSAMRGMDLLKAVRSQMQ